MASLLHGAMPHSAARTTTMRLFRCCPKSWQYLDLVDIQGLEQEQAVAVLGVSRKTIWRDIHDVRYVRSRMH